MDIGIRPRFRSLERRGVREMHPHLVWDYFEDQSGRIAAKFLHSGYTFFLNNGGFFELSANPRFERIEQPFAIHPGSPPIPVGSYGWNEWKLYGSSDPSRPVALSLTGFVGGLWSGTQRTVNGTLTLRPSYHFRMDLGMQWTSADLALPDISFVSTILTARSNYSFNTRLFLDALIQYDRDRRLFNANLRFNLIHRPLSDLYVVFNEQRFATPDSPAAGRGLIVKFTRLISF
jgi:hypothetical protein